MLCVHYIPKITYFITGAFNLLPPTPYDPFTTPVAFVFFFLLLFLREKKVLAYFPKSTERIMSKEGHWWTVDVP